MDKNYFILLFFLLINFTLFSQKDSLKFLSVPEVEILQMRVSNFQTGIKIVQFDSLNSKCSHSLSELLMTQNFGQIQSYSPGQLATPSFRGTSANHTAIIWNGFNIQSTMNGQTDFSLIQNIASNPVKVQLGGNGALWGSGAVGGVIHLQNKLIFNKGITAIGQFNFGSFANLRQQAEIEISKKKYILSLRFFNQDITNDFTFINSYLPDNKIVKQSNSAIKMTGIVLTNQIKITNNHNFNINLWLQNAQREIPPTMLSIKKSESQFDNSLKSSFTYSYTKNFFSLQARSGYFLEKIQFNRPLYDTSKNQSHSLISEIESMIKPLPNHTFQLGINHTYITSEGNNLSKNKIHRFAIFSSYKIVLFKDILSIQFSVREQIESNKFTPFTFGFGVEYKLSKNVFLSTNFNRNFRLPTLNDLYWTDASGTKGNPNLKPELGYSQDVTFLYTLNKVNNKFSFNVTMFNSFINNWINWREDNFGRLTPQNIQSVWSRGLEYGFSTRFKLNKTFHTFQFNADYTVSTIEKSISESNNLLKKQLIYVPFNKSFINYTFLFHKTTFLYQWTYTGFRYSTEDNEDFLPSFHVSNIVLNQEVDLKNFNINLFLKCNNIFNQNYQILASRPTYGINFNVGVIFKFNQINKN